MLALSWLSGYRWVLYRSWMSVGDMDTYCQYQTACVTLGVLHRGGADQYRRRQAEEQTRILESQPDVLLRPSSAPCAPAQAARSGNQHPCDDRG